jgi:HSP20 family protein
MTIVHFEPIRELASLQGEMNRLFNTLFDPPGSGGGNAGARRWVPAMDLVETEDALVLRADLPGMDEGDVRIEVEDGVLSVSGERKAEHAEREQGFYRLERAFGQFARTLTLPKGVDPEAVTAHFDRGVLEVRIPKPETVKPRRIEITPSGDRQQTIEQS